MEHSGLSISDALALQNKDGMFGGGSGGWPLFLIFLLAWGNGGFGFGGNNGALNQVNNDFLYNGIQRSISDLANSQSRGLDVVNGTIGQGFNQLTNQAFGLSKDLAQYNYNNAIGQASLSREISDCCCATNRNIDATRYEMSKGFCDVITANNINTRDIIASQTAGFQRVIDVIAQNEMQRLRDANSALQLANTEIKGNLANSVLADTIINRLNPCPVPAYPACPIRSQFGGWGCGSQFNSYNS